MRRVEDFDGLAREIEAAGYYTSFMSDQAVLVCVSDKSPDGRLYGKSFKVSRNKGHWFVATWLSDPVFMVPKDANIVDFCLKCLRKSDWRMGHFPEEVVEEFGLIAIPDDYEWED